MKIAFRKISSQRSPFEVDYEGVSFCGDFKRDRDLITISSHIKGSVTLPCDRCGDEFTLEIDENVGLKVNEGYYEGEDLDILESHDHHVDFDAIAQSEIEAIKAEYHYCDACNDTKGEQEDGST
jgi:uncharacterized metal-binding protein YceD (DUF177 family)